MKQALPKGEYVIGKIGKEYNLISLTFKNDILKKYKKEILVDVEYILNKIKNSKIEIRLRYIKITLSNNELRYKLVSYAKTKKCNTHWFFSDVYIEVATFIMFNKYMKDYNKTVGNVATYFKTGSDTHKEIIEKPLSHIQTGKIEKKMVITHHKNIPTENKLHLKYPTLNDREENLGLMIWNGHTYEHKLKSLNRRI